MILHTFWPMFKKECNEQYRTYRLLIAVIILLLLGTSAPIVTKLTPDLLQNIGAGITITLPPQTAMDALASYLKNMTQLPPLMLILLAMGCIADERSRGTAVTVLTKPVPRSVFALSKFFAYALTFLLSTMLAASGAYFYTYQLFNALPAGPFLLLNLALLIYFLLMLAMTILASTLFRSSIAAGGLTLLGFLILSVLSGLSEPIAQALPTELFSPRLLPHIMDLTASPGDILWPLGIGLGISAAFLFLACLIFQRQEI